MELKVGQLLMTHSRDDGTPMFAKVIRVNKNSYRVKMLSGDETSVNKETFMEVNAWYSNRVFVPVDMSVVTKEAFDRFMSIEAFEKKKEETMSVIEEATDLISHAKYFLKMIDNIRKIDPKMPEIPANSFYDWEDQEDIEEEEE